VEKISNILSGKDNLPFQTLLIENRGEFGIINYEILYPYREVLEMKVRKIGLGSLSLLMAIIGIIWAFTFFGVSIGDNIPDFLGLKAWSNGSTGTHYTVYYSLLFFIPAFITGIKYKENFGATTGKISFAIIGTFIIRSIFLVII